MKHMLARLGLVAMMVSTLVGCGGGGGGAADSTVVAPPVTVVPPVGVVAAAASNWAALAPTIAVSSVTIASPPVVKFQVTDATGKGITGLGTKSAQGATANVANLANIAFTLAKLVPGTNGGPSKWVSLNVLKAGTKTQQAAGYTQAATESCTPNFQWCGTYPTSDREGTMVDNGDGTYTYTFYRDPKLVKDLVATLVDSTDGLSKKADLGDLTFDPTATHRLGIQVGGNAPGVTPSIAMGTPANITYDFRPDGKAVSNTRDIVKIDSCAACHDGKVLAHGSRKDPNYCVTCHTDQVRYSFSMEAPVDVTGLALTGGVTGTTQVKRAEQAVVDNRAVGNFPNFMHKLHMGSKLTKTGYNYNAEGGAMLFNTVKTPGNVLNCTKCHSGATQTDAGLQAVKTTNGDNWKTAPSRLACGACHDGINFATGTGTTASGATTGHGTGSIGGPQADDSACASCHSAAVIAVAHSDALPTNSDATKRTMSATISKAEVDASGGVTVTFSLTDNGVAVTDSTKFSGMAFSLAKLNKAATGTSTHWESYTARGRTTVDANPPVITGYSEASSVGTLTHTGGGVWTYKFGLANADTAGDIRTITHVHNASSTTTITGAYSQANMPTLVNAVSYDPTLTHRVGMEFSKAATTTPAAAAVANKFNAIYDWVPDGNTTAQTRNIVSMKTCATCHEGQKLHKGFTTEYCVTCHNQNTYDPSSGTAVGVGSKVVDLQVIVHKLHMGKDLPSVIAGTPYQINGAGHDYSAVSYPGVISKCEKCHSPTATKADGATLLENAANWYSAPNKRACTTCHDSAATVTHADYYVGTGKNCADCHNDPSKAAIDVRTAHR
ncbi:MAG: OmcA/MtrC family decaheme c-type cytochrome [Sulfuritalea sp.]|jgi:hypothetical protein|nr:OmcA/MtrC family decaheme c-type cytochrome [Sulfuritalea sp.]